MKFIYNIHRIRIIHDLPKIEFSIKVNIFRYHIESYRQEMKEKYCASKIHFNYTKIPYNVIKDRKAGR